MSENDTADTDGLVKKNRILPKMLIVVVLVGLCIFFFTGFFVQQPIGAVPDGVTIWYFRTGVDLPFIVSADGFSLEKTGSVSLFSRGIAISEIMEKIKDKRITNLPYMEFLYKISTSGKTFE